MKKKIFNLLMMAVIFAASSSVFVSCKDNVSDESLEQHKMIADNLKQLLDQQEKALQQELNALKIQQANCKTNCQAALNDLAKKIQALQNADEKYANDIEWLKKHDEAAAKEREAIRKEAEGLKNQIASLRQESESLKKQIEYLKAQDAAFQTAISDIKSTLANVQISINNNKQDIQTLFSLHNSLCQTVDNVKNLAQAAMNLANDAYNLAYQTNGIATEAKQIAEKNKQDIANLVTNITNITNQITTIETNISNLQDSVSQVWAKAESAYDLAVANKKVLDTIQIKFADYYTIHQIDSMNEIIDANIAATKKVAEHADSLAGEAWKLAEQANNNAIDAYTHADDALNKALIASDSAQLAFNKASEAYDSAIVAKTQAILAEAKAATAQETAELAKSAAEAAQSTADTAKENAQKAQEAADKAKEDAQKAQETADKAKENAQKAQEAADKAKEDAQKAQETADKAKEDAQKAQETADKAKEDAQKAQETANAAQTTANTAEKKADDAQKKADDAWTDAQTAISNAAAAQGTADAAKSLADANKLAIDSMATAMEAADQALQAQIDTLKSDLAEVKEQVQDILKEIGIIKSDLAKMIVNILVQDVANPVTGNLTTPFGLDTNILCAFYGEATQDVDFPVDALGAEAYNLIGSTESFIIGSGETLVDNMDGGKAYAGRIYTTINPNTVNFAGEKLTLETSAGNASPITLDPLKKSDNEIKFGYTRADNGFYEADAYVSYDKIYSVSVNKALNGTGLKSLAKEILNKIKDVAKTKKLNGGTNDINLTNAYKTIMNAVSDVMPAYALKATWTDSAQTKHSIFSNYNIAATSVHPASFEFLKDWNAPNIPLIGHINYDVDFHLDYPTYHNIDDPNLEVKVYVVYYTSYGVESVIGVYSDKAEALARQAEYPGAQIKEMKYTVSGLSTFIETINQDIINKLTSDIESLEHQIVDQTQGNVNKALSKINNKVIDRINNIIKKINLRLDNANYYLQPTMIFQGGDGKWYIMSNVKEMPAVVQGTGGMILEPTSLTAELFAPAFKKFIAVTNVWKNGDESISAKNGDATCKAALNAANGATNMCKILSGAEDVLFNATKAGYTYEISYAAVDYSGKVVCPKFYVKVK